RPPRRLAREALPGDPRDHRAVAGLRALGARLRRPGAARLPVSGALVDHARPVDPAQDDPGRTLAPRRLLGRLPVNPASRRFSEWSARRTGSNASDAGPTSQPPLKLGPAIGSRNAPDRSLRHLVCRRAA